MVKPFAFSLLLSCVFNVSLRTLDIRANFRGIFRDEVGNHDNITPGMKFEWERWHKTTADME
jgi:hypothetical protein